jgi:hypothetical protein
MFFKHLFIVEDFFAKKAFQTFKTIPEGFVELVEIDLKTKDVLK